MRRKSVGRFASAAAVALALIPGLAAAAETASPERGLLFAQRNCAACHAIGPTGTSPYSAAPPFRLVLQRSPADALVKLLTEGLTPDHKAYREMQYFVLSPYEAADLAAYWKSLHVEPADN
jgi:cytochrome c